MRRNKYRFSHFMILLIISLALGCWKLGPRSDDWNAPVIAGYNVYRNSRDNIYVANFDALEGTSSSQIPKKVVELGHTETFIIAKQQEFDLQPNDDHVDDLIPDQFKYWIVNVKTHEIWGPLEIEEYTATRSELKIDPALKLRNVREYRE